MKIWAVANQKGGVGKTTTTVTLAGLLAERGQRTLMVDLDPHGSLTTYFGLDPDDIGSSAYNLFQAQAKGEGPQSAAILYPTRFEHLTLIPAATALATLDRQLGAREGMGLVINRFLQQLKHDYDYVLIDCPPMLGVLMINALAACTELLIPVQTEFLALKGLERMCHTLDMMGRSRPGGIAYTVVPTMYDRRTRASGDAHRVLQDRYAQHLWDGVIPVDTKFREASKAGTPLSLYHRSSRGVLAYTELLDSLCGETAVLPTVASAPLAQLAVR